jgi:hypothetical protein
MDFRILGPLEVLDEGRAVALGGSKQRALLALLLLHANQTLSADRLIDELWGEHPPATAAKTLQAHVSRLRKALAADDEAVVTRAHGYELKLDPGCLDADRFERLGVTGAVREEHGVVAGELARVDGVREDGHRCARSGEPPKDRALAPVVDDGDANRAGVAVDVRLRCRHLGDERSTLHRRPRTNGRQGVGLFERVVDGDCTHRTSLAQAEHE